jgi:alkylation response protein AidB-like acyl-CoA dehydrogenase
MVCLIFPGGSVMSLQEFRAEAEAWVDAHCPPSLRGREMGPAGNGARRTESDSQRWFDACSEMGYTVPNWPKEYGGAGLDAARHRVLREAFRKFAAPAPLGGMGVTMIGPTLLEHGNDEQKSRHLPKIANGEIRWCQGYSEPGAGSDLASLQTRAEDQGDYYLVNGSKIWTSGAHLADWIFCLVRTDPRAPKHEGISFLLFSMKDPGVTVKPIVLINGTSPFCQCFFTDVKVPKRDLVGKENHGWTIAKRLLQHERSSLSGLGGGGARPDESRLSLMESARTYVGTDADGRISDPALREQLIDHDMRSRAFALTQRRSQEENQAGGTLTFATSMFKYFSSETRKRRYELQLQVMGTQALGWDGAGFSDDELAVTRTWLRSKSGTIAGGSSEVQLNIIAKRVLGLPD